MRIEIATRAEIREVALNMRARDYIELSSLYPADTRAELAEAISSRYAGRDDVWCARGELGPIAIGVMVETRPNVITLGFFATDSFPEIAVEVTRFLKRRLFPKFRAAGVHRIECVSLEGYDEAHHWLEVLGLRREFLEPQVGFGKKGEPFAWFAWKAECLSA